MIATGCLLVLMLIATATDLWQHKIFNWTTYSGILIAFALGLVTTLDPADISAKLVSKIGIGESIAGFLVCGFVLLFCYVLFNVGAGDVKLIAMMGAFMGVSTGVEALLWTFVLGGATGVIVLIWKMGAGHFFRTVTRLFISKLGRGIDMVSEDDRKQLQLPLYLAPNALIAVLLVQFRLVEGIM